MVSTNILEPVRHLWMEPLVQAGFVSVRLCLCSSLAYSGCSVGTVTPEWAESSWPVQSRLLPCRKPSPYPCSPAHQHSQTHSVLVWCHSLLSALLFAASVSAGWLLGLHFVNRINRTDKAVILCSFPHQKLCGVKFFFFQMHVPNNIFLRVIFAHAHGTYQRALISEWKGVVMDNNSCVCYHHTQLSYLPFHYLRQLFCVTLYFFDSGPRRRNQSKLCSGSRNCSNQLRQPPSKDNNAQWTVWWFF